MNGMLAWVIVALGLGVVAVRRRSLAVGLVTAQAFMLVGLALRDASSVDETVTAAVLGLRGVAFAALLLFLASRTREPRPVRAGVSTLTRTGLAVTFALLLTWLIPVIEHVPANAQRAVIATVAFGVVAAATRRATIFQILAIVLVENGLVLAAIEFPGVSSSVIEIGVTLDLLLVALVAAVFHEKIFAEFGAGDSSALRSLRE